MSQTSTYTFDDLLRMISKFVPKNVPDDHSSDIINLTWSKIWHSYDWKESIKTLPPFHLIPNEQDIGPPFYTVPDDFAGLRKVDLVNLQSNPPLRKELTVIKDLNLTHIRYKPHSIGYNPDTRSFRVFNRTTENMGAPYWQIEGTYKNLPTKITPATITTAVPTKDDYLTMWLEGMKWAALNFAGSREAGQVQIQNGQVTYTGQLAVFMHTLEECKMNEGLELGDNYIHPSEPLTTTYNNTLNSLFGNF